MNDQLLPLTEDDRGFFSFWNETVYGMIWAALLGRHGSTFDCLYQQTGARDAACYAAWCRAVPPSVSSLEDYMVRFEKALRFCVNCDIPVMRLDSGIDMEPLSDEEYRIRFDCLIRNWRSAARLAGKMGITLVLESEPPMWINRPSEVLAAVQAVNEPNFRLLFDASHAYLQSVKGACQTGEKEILPGGILEYIHMMGPYIGYVHMVDTDGNLSATDSAGTSVHLPLGEGILDFDAIIETLWPYAGHLPFWSLDFYDCHDAERTGIESLRFLREKVAKHEKIRTIRWQPGSVCTSL
ncbi:MAG: sugar phosphate isomerase/epimerase [Clostridia bacterium]|nr:sugar phosphate isomerase/epimerase [Clostridia bacterium]